MPDTRSELFNKVKQSGHNLLASLNSILIQSGWETTINGYYKDDITSKYREYDLLARKNLHIPAKKDHSSAPADPGKNLDAALSIECKYFLETEAFCLREFSPRKKIEEIIRGMLYADSGASLDLSSNLKLSQLPTLGVYDYTSGNKDKFFEAWNAAFQALPRSRRAALPLVLYDCPKGHHPFYKIPLAKEVASAEELKPVDKFLFVLNHPDWDYQCIAYVHINEIQDFVKGFEADFILLHTN